MPTVPRYERRVAEAPLPNARLTAGAPAEAFGVPQGVDLSGVQRVATQIWEEERQKANQIAVTDASAQLSATATRLLTEAQSRRGKDAFGVPDVVTDGWKKSVEEIRKGLTNDVQRLAFDNRVASEWVGIDRQVQRHVAGERQAYDNATTDAFIQNTTDKAITNYTDPELVALSAAEIGAAVRDWGKRNGLPPEAVQQRVAEATSKVHVGVLGRMLDNGQDLAAKAYYDTHKAALTGADASNVEKALEAGSTLGESQRQADAIMARPGVTRAQAFELARQIEDPKVRQATEQRLDVEWHRRDQAAEAAYDQAFEQAAAYAERGQRPPATLWATLKARDRHALDTWLRQQAAGEKIETDWVTYYDLKQMAANPATREAFLRTSLLSHRGKLGDTEFKELVTLQAAARKGDATADVKLDGYRTIAMVVGDGLLSVGLDPSPKPGTEEAKRVARFHRMVDTQVRALEQRTGKEASPDDVQKIVDNLLVRGVVSGSGFLGLFQDERHVFETEPGRELEIDVEAIPSTERAQIRAAFQRRGITPTDEQVLALYRRRLQELRETP